MTIKNLRRAGLSLIATTALAGAASAASLNVTITNESGADGFYLTPFLNVFHDGSFTPFTVGASASTALEDLAEEGAVGGVRADAEAAGFATQVAIGPEGFGSTAPQPPVLDPGETSTFTIDLDVEENRFFTFLSMVIPSNDTFIANGNPMAYELFDANGNFTGIPTINVDLADVWDAGTEVNDGQGAAFNAAGGSDTTEVGTVLGIENVSALDFLFGESTAAGTVTSANGVNFSQLATITFTEVSPVPLPAGLPMLLAGLGLLGVTGVRRKRAA